MTGPTTLLAIDPGARHCGWTLLLCKPWRTVKWGTDGPNVFLDRLDRFLAQQRNCQLVVEEFRLYPKQASAKSWDTLREVEVIGVIKWLARWANVPIEMQRAMVRKVAAGHLRAEGRRLAARGVHARDAELHAWFFLKRREWK